MEKEVKKHLRKIFNGFAAMSMSFCHAKVKTKIASIEHDIIDLADTQVSMITRTGQEFVFFPNQTIALRNRKNRGMYAYNSQTVDTIKDIMDDILALDFSISDGKDGTKADFLVVKKAILSKFWENMDSYSLNHGGVMISEKVKKLQKNYKFSVRFKKLGLITSTHIDGTPYTVFCTEMSIYGWCELFETPFVFKKILTGKYAEGKFFMCNEGKVCIQSYFDQLYEAIYEYIATLDELCF